MSVEEDVELRDLVAQTLESNGSLAKIRAQLRASIFLALEEDVKISKKQPILNNKLKSYQKTAQGKAAFCIVREFLDYFNLDFTISVYEPESYLGTGYKYEGRQKLVDDLGINGLDLNSSGPLLLQLLSIAQKLKPVSAESITENGDVSILNGELNGVANETIDTNSKSKTESNNLVSNPSSIIDSKNEFNKLKSQSNENVKQNKFDLEIDIPRVNLNSTFDVSSPSSENLVVIESNHIISSDHIEEVLGPEAQINSDSAPLSPSREQTDKEDTYGGTSSILEDNISLSKVQSYIDPSPKNEDHLSSPHPIKQLTYDNESSVSIIKENKSKYDIEKPKLSPQKSEKIKAKANLSSLSDLPPLPLGKTRMSDILPSLYNKEFKEKSNLKELDDMFDMQVDYEEDFMSGSDIDLSINKSDPLVSGKSSKTTDKTLSKEVTESVNGSHNHLNSDHNNHTDSGHKKKEVDVSGDGSIKESTSVNSCNSSISESLGNDSHSPNALETK